MIIIMISNIRFLYNPDVKIVSESGKDFYSFISFKSNQHFMQITMIRTIVLRESSKRIGSIALSKSYLNLISYSKTDKQILVKAKILHAKSINWICLKTNFVLLAFSILQNPSSFPLFASAPKISFYSPNN